MKKVKRSLHLFESLAKKRQSALKLNKNMMEMNPLENLFFYRYARLIMDNRQGLVSSAVSDKQRLLNQLFSSLHSESKPLPGDVDNMLRQLRRQTLEMSRLADRNIQIASKLKELVRLLSLIRNNLQRMEQIVTALRQGKTLDTVRAEFERLASENKQYLEQLAKADLQMEQAKTGEKNIAFSASLDLVSRHSFLSDTEEQGRAIAEDLKNILATLENVIREQGQAETLAQELYFGADILRSAVADSTTSISQDTMFSQAIDSSTGFIFNETT